MFLNNPYDKYDFFYNSTQNKRGVGILIKSTICYSILDTKKSADENILLLRANIRDTEVALVSIYGPNNNDPLFFDTLAEFLAPYEGANIIMGGDWNCTYSADPIHSNIDCINMARVPNASHSTKLLDLCSRFNLFDPFRFLFPEKRDFTFVPRSILHTNKSRIDFFTVSEPIIEAINECSIAPALQNKLFDHKAINLTINRVKTLCPRISISNTELDDDLLEFLILATVAETYLIHGTGNLFVEGRSRDALLNICGTIKNLIRECGPPVHLCIGSDDTENKKIMRDRFLVRLQVLSYSVPLQAIENINLNCDALIFMETLLLNVKNEVTSHQSFMRKLKRQKINQLRKNIDIEKRDYLGNFDNISRSEIELNALEDAEMRKKLQSFKNFEILNTEKMTPRFLTLANISKKQCSLDCVTKPDGDNFGSSAEREAYILDFYSKLYQKKSTDQVLNDNCIEEFLGHPVNTHPVVTNSKLNAAEKEFFDRGLSIQELDNALEKMSTKSAGGIDGISTLFLKNFWRFFRTPLHKYATVAFERGELTQSFNSAVIRLIPKKGDITQIKNWRPISLLNCIYKILSKALDARLQKLNEIILSRAQKGFTSKRNLQECLINIVENISYAESEKIPCYLLALDMAKAFDTVRHDFTTLAYKFFGIGDNLIRMLNTISTNRTACILRDDDTPTAPFTLGAGFAQGNAPSPNQFNIVEQIFIFKIEFDPRIQKIKDLHGPMQVPVPVPVPIPAPAPVMQIPARDYGVFESNYESGNVEAFADDNNVMARLDEPSLNAIKESLEKFAVISGLHCNVDKSQILIIGTDDDPPEYVINSGFSLVNKIKILGYNVTREFTELENNFTEKLEKLKSVIRFWERFRLSLPGRINVAKSLLLSQLSFLGSIIMPPDTVLDAIQKLINKFVLGTFRFNEKLICCPIDKGGLGLIDIKDFFISLQCSWIKKAAATRVDNWQGEIRDMSGNNIPAISPDLFNENSSPLLRQFANSFYIFKQAFYSFKPNFMQSVIYGNPLVITSWRNRVPAGNNIINLRDPDAYHDRISRIRISDLLSDTGSFKGIQEINLITGLTFSQDSYDVLKKSITDSVKIVTKNCPLATDPGTTLDSFLTRFKKGSKNFRKVLTNAKMANLSLAKNTRIKTFFSLISVQIPDEPVLKKLTAQWSINCYPVKLRDFIFKFRNNILGLNVRVNHFNNGQSRNCTFCTISRRPNFDETFLHIFYECPVTNHLLKQFFRIWTPELNFLNEDEEKKFVFLGINNLTGNLDNFFISTLSIFILFYIWSCKLSKRIPVLEGLKNDLFFEIESIRRLSSTLREDMSLNLAICRAWREEAGSRR
jgi:exonuclease III